MEDINNFLRCILGVDYGVLKKYTRDLNILFVEDDEYFRYEFSNLLEDIFPNVFTCADGKEAIDLYNNYYDKNNNYIDLIITDIKMPNLDGVDLIKDIYLKNQEQMVVVLSARNEFSYLLPLINLGIQHFFPKPIDYSTFLNEILSISKKIYHKKEEENQEVNTILKINNSISWSTESKELFKNQSLVKLTKMEIILLDKITKDNARVFTIEELFHTLWDDNSKDKATLDNLKNVVSRLRKKVPELEIKSLYGLGYKLIIE